MGFSHGAQVVVAEVDGENWKVIQSFSYTGKLGQTFTVPVGQRTDFASVPRVYVWFLPRYGRYTLAAILHDYLWRHVVQRGELPYVDADGIFRRAMRELVVPFFKRWMMWAAVRWAARGRPRDREGWLREGCKVVLPTEVAAPFLLPAGAVVGLTLMVTFVVEWVCMV